MSNIHGAQSVTELEKSLAYHEAEVKRLKPLLRKRKLVEELQHPESTLTSNGVTVKLRLVNQIKGLYDRQDHHRGCTTILRPIETGKVYYLYRGYRVENKFSVNATAYGCGITNDSQWATYHPETTHASLSGGNSWGWKFKLAPGKWNEELGCNAKEIIELRHKGYDNNVDSDYEPTSEDEREADRLEAGEEEESSAEEEEEEKA